MQNNTSRHFFGDEALDRLRRMIGYVYEEHAIGSVFIYESKDGTPTVTDMRETFAQLLENSNNSLLEKNLGAYGETSLIVVDSGNTDGDAFKYIYHIGQMSGTEIQENPTEYHYKLASRATRPA